MPAPPASAPPTLPTRFRVRLRQAGVLAVGLVLAGVMVLLGLWQLDVYHAQGAAASQARAAEPARPVSEVARAGQAVLDGYGRTVTFSGRYLAQDQLLVPLGDGDPRSRVVTALRLDDGDVLAVVRGLTTDDTPPAVPAGPQQGRGLLLPSEESDDDTPSAGGAGTVRVTALAQSWPSPLVAGVLTLAGDDAQAQGLEPAPVQLPEARGRLRNGAYALQWWVFAAFAVGLGLRIARDQERLLALGLGDHPDEFDDPDEAAEGEGAAAATTGGSGRPGT